MSAGQVAFAPECREKIVLPPIATIATQQLGRLSSQCPLHRAIIRAIYRLLSVNA
jgi:hypothetical protein